METGGGVGNGMALRVKKMSEFATVPTRGSPQAAGYDLYRYVKGHLILGEILSNYLRCNVTRMTYKCTTRGSLPPVRKLLTAHFCTRS